MIYFVQRFDKRTGKYIKIDAQSLDVVAESPTPFLGVEEIEPIEVEIRQEKQSDPLGDYR